jgi:hypothetical protein
MPTAPVLDGMAGAYGNLYIAATDGTLSCLGAAGQALAALSSDKIEELNKNSAPPPPEAPAKGGKKKAAARKAAPIKLPPRDADFSKLENAHAYQAELGYRVAAEPQAFGTVLKKLDTPLSGKVTLKCTLHYINEDGPNNGYLAFGDSADEEQLVKCGLRVRMKTAAIIQGPLAKNKGATTPCVTDSSKQYTLSVTVDLASGEVTFQSGAATVTAKLERPMKSITHVGYSINGAVTDFSPIEISVAP